MECLTGKPALSPFRVARLLDELADRTDSITAIETRFVHFVDLDSALTNDDRRVLERLLDYGDDTGAGDCTGTLVLVVPRLGTISPWATKATEIARNCGLANVRRIERGIAYYLSGPGVGEPEAAAVSAAIPSLHDRMTQSVLRDLEDAEALFSRAEPAPVATIDVRNGGAGALAAANREMGLALADDEIEYLLDNYQLLDRNPTDVELMMFAQANSEHCRHKVFNASWLIDGRVQDRSLFSMIRNTHERRPEGVLSAYRDNAAVAVGHEAARFLPDPDNGVYRRHREPAHLVMKVETHNHPTAIAPAAGAATGVGGEIRDEGATGRGAQPKAGLAGFSVSNLDLPGARRPWEVPYGRPGRIASALEIMRDAPIGAASYANEFGRPSLAGYFRTYEQRVPGPRGEEVRGFHKPIMIAGGMGNIRGDQVAKGEAPPGAPVVVLGGAAMLIGLGGGAASSMTSGESDEELDFASVQRSNPEIQRRCQEVIDACWRLGHDNPVIAIHDVGAGGLSNAIPELLDDSGRGGRIELRTVPNDDPGMSPMALWCNEAQERYVLALDPDRLPVFERICERERAPFAVVGETTSDRQLVVGDAHFGNTPVDMPMDMLLGKPPKMLRDAHHRSFHKPELALDSIDPAEAAERVLTLPAVAAKHFLITIGDRSVSGLIARDQMVGPWQVPVADAAMTLLDYDGFAGEAMAIGERSPAALLHAPASGRLAIGEALTNLASTPVGALANVNLSANWMAAVGHDGEDAALYDTVRAVGMELCPRLGIAIPVGKDSLSMRTAWGDGHGQKTVTAPLSLIISAFAPVEDVRLGVTPQLRTDAGETELWLIDLGKGANRLGATALAQVYRQVGHHPADVDDPDALAHCFAAVQTLLRVRRLLAYHDRSDGGLFATVVEMAFAGHTGVDLDLDGLGPTLAALFSEELGAVVQIRTTDREAVTAVFRDAGLSRHCHLIGTLSETDRITVRRKGQIVLDRSRVEWQRLWQETSWRMQSLRDNPDCAAEEYDALLDERDPGLHAALSFVPDENPAAPRVARGARPRVAVLREQGVNSHVEMAAAFDRAGFDAVDVHMTDLLAGRHALDAFQVAVACGGFSYGDVLGAGGGWAKSILFNARLRDQFAAFFDRPDTLSLGVCNGCQMMAGLGGLIPGTELWPRFLRNRSEQYEARLALVEVLDSDSPWWRGMNGSRLPIAVAHGEGRATFDASGGPRKALAGGVAVLRYVDHHGRPAETYPFNPSGSPMGLTGFTSRDGRVTVTMPHPERVFRAVQHSWYPREWGEDGPWMRLFRNARCALT